VATRAEAAQCSEFITNDVNDGASQPAQRIVAETISTFVRTANKKPRPILVAEANFVFDLQN
jgi:hypothetical protein